MHGVSAFQLQFADHAIQHRAMPADDPDRHESCCAEEQPAPRAPRRAPDHQQRRVHRSGPGEGRLLLRPVERRHPGILDQAQSRRDHATVEARRASRSPRRRPSARRHVRPRASSRSTPGPRGQRFTAKFGRKPEILAANLAAFICSGLALPGEHHEDFAVHYEVSLQSWHPGMYRKHHPDNMALSYGLIAAAELSGLPLFLGFVPPPRQRHPPRAQPPQGVRRAPCNSRTRSPASAPPSGGLRRHPGRLLRPDRASR